MNLVYQSYPQTKILDQFGNVALPWKLFFTNPASLNVQNFTAGAATLGQTTASALTLNSATPVVSANQIGIGTTTATTATAGTLTLPSNPVGFLQINVGGAMVKVPYYSA